MISVRAAAQALVAVAVVSGAVGDRVPARTPVEIDGYQVLAADFHVHSATWSDGALTPWGLVLEAQRQGLDVIAVTGHNQVSDGRVARWVARELGGPLVLTGQEILAPHHHVIAVGIDRVVDSRLPVADQIDAVHQQGGVAIAAHPRTTFWPAFDSTALERLDGAEICHPVVYGRPDIQRELEAFAEKGTFAAIGSSDFHGLGRMGMCRTLVFARDGSAPSVLEALRARRTVVYADGGHVFGPAELVQKAARFPALREASVVTPPASPLDWISRVTGLLGLVGLVLAGSGVRAGSFSAEQQ